MQTIKFLILLTGLIFLIFGCSNPEPEYNSYWIDLAIEEEVDLLSY